MRTVNLASLLVIAVIGVLIVLRMLTIKIEPGQTGVVNAEWTGGLIEQDFGPGYHWDVGPFHTWSVFDTRVQTLHMTRDTDRGGVGDQYPPLLVNSSDGATVTVDVTLKYEIEPKAVWKVRKQFGSGDAYKAKVHNEAIDILRSTLGVLTTEDFYNPVKRRETAVKMEENLAVRLKLLDVRLIAILIRDLVFEKAFEEQIKKKTLAQQDVELNKALTQAADFRGRTAKIQAETDAKVAVINQEKEKTLTTMRAENEKKVAQIRADVRTHVTQLRAEAEFYAAQKEADGTRLMKESEAKGQELRRQAVGAAGGNVLVALELARNLKLGSMAVSTQQVNPLDVDSVMRMLGVK